MKELGFLRVYEKFGEEAQVYGQGSRVQRQVNMNFWLEPRCILASLVHSPHYKYDNVCGGAVQLQRTELHKFEYPQAGY